MIPRLLSSENDKSFFLFGPRGVGKTSWLKDRFPNALYFDLLDSRVYTSLLADPGRLAERIPKAFQDWIVLDEIQRVPELLNEVHRLVEEKHYKFVLTGSSARKLRRQGVNLLAGRARTRFMHPLTPEELGLQFSFKKSLQFGLLPSAVFEKDPADYLSAYVQTYLREEVQQEGLTRNIAAFSRFAEIVTFSQGCVLNMAEVARDCMVSPKVVQDYFTILEDLLLAVRLPVFNKKAKRKLITRPKFFLFDAGVFRSLRPLGPLDSQEEIGGASLETLFYQVARATNDYKNFGYDIFYWRTQRDQEVDFVLYGTRGILAFEVKRSNKIRSDDLNSLKLFQQDYPEAKCFLLYVGKERYIEHDIHIAPLEHALRNMSEILGNEE